MKILILSNLLSYTYNFRKEIIDVFVEKGHKVFLACDIDDGEKLEAFGKSVEVIQVPFNGKGKNPVEELRLLNTYKRIIKTKHPDIVFTFTIKMNLYGGMAAKRYRVPYVPMITGLGELEKGGKLRALLLFLHKTVMPSAECVIFQNEDNRRFFLDNGIKYKSSLILPGSGINLEKFRYVEYPKCGNENFVFLGRLIKAKGIEEYFDACEKLSSDKLIFHAAGPLDEGYKERLESLVKRGKLIYHGVLSDTRDYLASSSCLVLPTFHPEGLSNVILEAFAVGRPVIATDRTGCRELVRDGENGFFCREKDAENLIAVIKRMASLSIIEREKMGREGRNFVEKYYDRQIVVKAYLELLETR